MQQPEISIHPLIGRLLMTCIILGHLDGLGIGTILAAFTMGKVIGMIGDQMDRHVRFESFMTKRAA